MGEIRKESAPFTGYEYMELNAAGERAAFYLDCYQCFGWKADERVDDHRGRGPLVLRRERKLVNKAELTRLQRHFESCVNEIRMLERSKTANAAAWAVGVGLVGTAFMAGATFAAVHVPPLWGLTVLLGLPAFAGWVLPWFLYQKLVARRSAAVAGLIEGKYGEIDEICRQGSELLR